MADWLPVGFSHPLRVELPTGQHLRPIRADDVDIDHPAVMGSRERLRAKYGQAWRWPPAAMTVELDRVDLQHHEEEVGGELERALDAFVPRWLAETWEFRRVAYSP